MSSADEGSGQSEQPDLSILKQLQQIDKIVKVGTVSIVKRLTTMEERFASLAKEVRSLRSEIALVARRGSPRPGMPIRVMFLVHHITQWDTLDGIYRAMAEAPDFEPLVASIPRTFRGNSNWFIGEDETHQGLLNAGIPHFRFNSENLRDDLELLRSLEPDVIFRQSPHEIDVPPEFRTEEIQFARLCYVPYGYYTAAIEGEQFNQYYQRMCWRVFYPDEAHLDLHREHAQRGVANAVVTGYPKFDLLLEAGRDGGRWPINRGKKSYRVIWAPHHTVTSGWLTFGTFYENYRQALEWVRDHPEIEVVLKPHPLLFEWDAYGSVPKAALEEFKAAWCALPNAALIGGNGYGPLFAASDAMITDGVSPFSEYQLFDKPLVYLDSQKSVGFNRAGKILLEGMYRVTSFGEAISLIDRFRQGGEDTLREARARVVSRIHPVRGGAAGRIVEEIRRGLRGGC